MSPDSVSRHWANRSVVTEDIHDVQLTCWTKMILVKDGNSKPSFHADRPFQTRKFVLLCRESSNPCSGVRRGTCKQSCFVEVGGISSESAKAIRVNVMREVVLLRRAWLTIRTVPAAPSQLKNWKLRLHCWCVNWILVWTEKTQFVVWTYQKKRYRLRLNGF